MIQHAARWFVLLWMTTATGCYIPTWKIATPRPCQTAENAWGDVVDFVGHQSSVDTPCHDPRYCKRGVYRVAAPHGDFAPSQSGQYDQPPAIEAPSPIPPPMNERTGYLKP